MKTNNTEELYQDAMDAGAAHFRLNYSSLWHIVKGGTWLKVAEGIVIVRDVLIIDVSKWQGVIDFEKMKAAGIKGVIFKVGQGIARDSRFVENWAACKAAGIPRGTYWFWDSRIAPKVQAYWWWAWIKNDPGELMHFGDYEENYGGDYGGWQNFKIFLQEFLHLSNLPVAKVGIYTGYYYWIARSPTNATELLWFKQFSLWLAWYTTNPANVLIPKPWGKLLIWQYGTNGIDGKTPNGKLYGADSIEIDENNFSGNDTEYRLYFGLGATSIPDPIGGTMFYKVTADPKMNIRVGPGINYDDIGDLLLNNIIEVTETIGGWHNIKAIWHNGLTLSLPGPVCWCSVAFTMPTNAPVPSTPADFPPEFYISMTANGERKKYIPE